MDQERDRLRELNARLFRLHGLLLAWERRAYETDHEPVRSHELLRLLLHDPQFAWLRSLSWMMARIDEAVDADDPITADDAQAALREAYRLLKSGEPGEFQDKYRDALQALAIECAEALAEMLHARLRTLWGFPDPPDLPISEKLKAHYRGIRVSFGYPACPNLADQTTLFRLLEPEGIGLSLTEGFMMDPEASVSALVLHHPAAKYFKAD